MTKKKVIIITSVFIIILLIASIILIPFITVSINKGYYPSQLHTLKAETIKSDYSLTLDEQTGRFVVENSKNNVTWDSNPKNWQTDKTARDVWRGGLNSQLMVRYMSTDGVTDQTVNSYNASVRSGNATFNKTSTGFTAEYKFIQQGFTIPLEVKLSGNSMEVIVDTQKIKYDKETTNVVHSISLLPFFGAGSLEDTGYMLIPSGSGGVIDFNNGRNASGGMTVKVYGDDLTSAPPLYKPTAEYSRIPVFGLAKQNNSFIAVVEQGDAITDINAAVSMSYSEYNTIYPTFNLLSTDSFTLNDFTGKARDFVVFNNPTSRLKKVSVRYIFLDGKNNYNDMAESYKEYLIKNYDLKNKQTPRATTIDLYGAVLKDSMTLGISTKKPILISKAEDIKNLYKSLKANTNNNITFNLKNYTKDSIYSNNFTSFNTLSKLGNINTIKKALDNHDKLYLSVNPAFANQKTNTGYVSKTILNLQAYVPTYNLETKQKIINNVNYALSPVYLGQNILLAGEKSKDKAISFETIGENIYSDFGSKKLSRQDNANIVYGALGDLKSDGIDILSSGGNFYSVINSNGVINIPSTSGNSNLINYDIPFYQLVFGNIVSLTGKAINLNANPNYEFLKNIENGTNLHFAFILGDARELKQTELSSLCGAEYNLWSQTVKEYVKKADEVYKITNDSSLISHKKLEDNLFISIFKNGTKIIVNYNEDAVTVDGTQIKGMNYKIMGGE